MILHLIRHPKPLIEPGICYGQHDVAAENPALAAAVLRDKIPTGVPLWSSPLQRCRALAELLHPSPRFDPRLMEMSFGDWEGRPWDSICRSALDAWAADVFNFAPPAGESAAQVMARVERFLREQEADELVLLTHAGVIRLLLACARQQALDVWLNYPIPFGSVMRLQLHDPGC